MSDETGDKTSSMNSEELHQSKPGGTLEEVEEEKIGERRSLSAFEGEFTRGQTLPGPSSCHNHDHHKHAPKQQEHRHHKHHERSLAAFILREGGAVYRQRTWLARLGRQVNEDQDTDSTLLTPLLTSTTTNVGGKKHGRRRRMLSRMTPGSTLMSIGEACDEHANKGAAVGPLAALDAGPKVDVKVWPAFRQYKTLVAAAHGQRSAIKQPKPVVVRSGRPTPTTTVKAQPQRRPQQQQLPPTFARILEQQRSHLTASPALSTRRAPVGSMDPMFPLHLIRLAVLDGEEERACAILAATYGIPWADRPTNTDAPLKAGLLRKAKAWPVLLRIWLRAVERGMEELLLMLLAAGIPASPLQPIAFVAPRKAPPAPAPRFYSLAGLASSVSLLSTGSSSTAAANSLGGWLQRSYRPWILQRFPSFFMAALAFGRHNLVDAMMEGARKQAAALATATWLGITPLLMASALSNALATITSLLDAGANPSVGMSYYTWLLIRRKLVLMKRQHKGKLSEEAKLWARETPLLPLDCAAARQSLDTTLLLLNRSFLPDPSTLAPFIQHSLQLTARLLKAGAVQASISVDPFGSTPLHYAARHGSAGLLALYLHFHAPIDACNAHGRTALHEAALHGHVAALKFLLQAGADCSIKDASGQTALEVARRHGFTSEQLADYLSSSNAPSHEQHTEDVRSLIKQLDSHSLKDKKASISPAPNTAQDRPVQQQRKGRFLIEKIINPRQWWS